MRFPSPPASVIASVSGAELGLALQRRTQWQRLLLLPARGILGIDPGLDLPGDVLAGAHDLDQLWRSTGPASAAVVFSG